MSRTSSDSLAQTDGGAAERLACKLSLDPYYAPLSHHSAEQLLAAGFFDDGLPGSVREHPSWNPAMLTTPLAKVGRNLQRLTAKSYAERRPVRPLVLLSTGSFSPVHEGHLDMMERARRRAEQAGWTVVAGYLSPSHDQYVGVKRGGQAALHAEHRIALLEEALQDSDWLSVCPWEARHAPVSLNFTDVLQRLHAYLALQLSALPAPSANAAPLTVGYVFGSDNARFLEAFAEQGVAVCVQRGEWPAQDAQWLQELSQRAPERLLLATGGDGEFGQASSTAARQGRPDLVPRASQKRWQALSATSGVAAAPTPSLYLVRQDLAHCTRTWSVSQEAACEFEVELMSLLQQALGPDVRVQGMELREQLRAVQELRAQGPVLSLDACVQGDAQLQLCRLFDVGAQQVRSTALSARPGCAPLEVQLAALDPQQPWTVVDDDEATGLTRRTVEHLVHQQGGRVRGYVFLNQRYVADVLPQLGAQDVLDVVDARDFLLGAEYGGLVIALPDASPSGRELLRAPYLLPFVSLTFRAKIPADKTPELSQALWALNESWLARYAPSVTVAHANKGGRRLLERLGFATNTPLWVCARALKTWSTSGC